MLLSLVPGVALFSLWPVFALSQTCFWPNGTKADSVFKPCANNSGACCYYIDDGHHDLCYSNGFCLSLFFGYLYRGACTDFNWNSASGCATDCLNVEPAAEAIATFCSDDYSCCNSSSQTGSCCDGSSDTVVWNNATLLPRADLAGSLATATATVTETVTQGGSTVSALVSSTSVMSTFCSNNDMALGVGLGVPLGLAIGTILVMGWILVRRPKTVDQKASMTMGQTPGPFERPVPDSEASELGPSMDPRRLHGASELANSQR